jgi:GNAT superfamily N-acetyltransferase
VLDAHRDHGIGTALVRRIEAEAAAAGARRLHLYTPDAARFYSRLGWTTDERYTYLGQRVALMSKHLGPPRDPT